ncbi:MAG: HIT family protein [gamma proteobacterium symbiont of Bathyaustriella thionipta]|nr:HIT family protein [gamma proteobacterium symbiont of Bathyaustriella thionipta]
MNDSFILHAQLEADCHRLGELNQQILLLRDDVRFPWFILVPKVNVGEIFQLDQEQQAALWSAARQVSTFVESGYVPDKLNIATIGNVVPQLHLHIIARYQSDVCWPGVVWGFEGAQAYPGGAVDDIKSRLQESFLQTGLWVSA